MRNGDGDVWDGVNDIRCVVHQVLFSEQLKLRNAISSTTLARAERASDTPLQQQAATSSNGAVRQILPLQDGANSQMDIRALQHDVMFMKARFAELQKDYYQVTQQVLVSSSAPSCLNLINLCSIRILLLECYQFLFSFFCFSVQI